MGCVSQRSITNYLVLPAIANLMCCLLLLPPSRGPSSPSLLDADLVVKANLVGALNAVQPQKTVFAPINMVRPMASGKSCLPLYNRCRSAGYKGPMTRV